MICMGWNSDVILVTISTSSLDIFVNCIQYVSSVSHSPSSWPKTVKWKRQQRIIPSHLVFACI